MTKPDDAQSAPLGAAAAPLYLQAQELATQLTQMLELEFAALREQQLDEFERLQPVKTELLATLSALVPDVPTIENDPEWQQWIDDMRQCRDLHRRNAVLMERKLESIRGALDSLRLPEATSSVEVYDRLGHVARFARGRGYSDA